MTCHHTRFIFILFATILLACTNTHLFVRANVSRDLRSSTSSSTYDTWLLGKSFFYNEYIYMENTARSGGVHVHWKIDTDSNLHVAVATNATGWVGFGIAEAGGMPGSDIVVFTAADNSLTDMHALAYATPIVDTCQDWDLVNSTVDTDDGILIFEASRAVNTGDLQDREVKDDSDPFTPAHRVIAAWGNSENIFYHGENRTSGSIRFFQSSKSVESRKNSTSFIDLVTNFTIPATQTTYESKCFPDWSSPNPVTNGIVDAHLTGISFIEDSETTEYVHHLLLFGKEEYTYFVMHF